MRLEIRILALIPIAFRPSTLLAFHQALVRRKYHRLFSSTPCPKKPGPTGPDQALAAADACRMFNAAIHERGTPRHLSTDHDLLFEPHQWAANLRILEIDEIETVPHVPLSYEFETHS